MKNYFGWYFNRIVIVINIIIAAAMATHGVAATAQGAQQDPTQVKLSKTVHLNLGVTTVDKVMAALSEQTGLTIKATNCLNERTLTVRLESISAAAALEALDELNDWNWSATKSGEIVVKRRRLQLDANVASLPRLMQAAIPGDIRTFLHVASPSEDMTKHVFASGFPPAGARRDAFLRLQRTIVADQAGLFASLMPGILTSEPKQFASLTPVQRGQLLLVLVFPLLREMDYWMLNGDTFPHVVDIRNAVLQLSGASTLLVGSEVDDGKTTMGEGYGAEIR